MHLEVENLIKCMYFVNCLILIFFCSCCSFTSNIWLNHLASDEYDLERWLWTWYFYSQKLLDFGEFMVFAIGPLFNIIWMVGIFCGWRFYFKKKFPVESQNQHDWRRIKIYKLFVYQHLENCIVLLHVSYIVHNSGKANLAIFQQNCQYII